jgi:PleD family two-component response regulator
MAIANLPDVIVSEVILHRLDGFSLREELLNNSTTKDIKTVFLSFKKDETSVKRAIQMGVTIISANRFFWQSCLELSNP